MFIKISYIIYQISKIIYKISYLPNHIRYLIIILYEISYIFYQKINEDSPDGCMLVSLFILQ